jgi:putative ABC transport system permease protein
MVWRRRSTEDFSEEIRAHIALETDRLIAEGMSPDEAARAAQRRFGNVTVATERFHESRRVWWLDELRQDFHAARRNLVRYPIVAIVAVLSLGAGIGATAASLTVRDVIFQNPPPLYVEPRQLSKIQVIRQDRQFRPMGGYVPADLFTRWRSAMGPSMGAAAAQEGVSDVRLPDRIEPTRIRAVTADLFTVLGVAPEIGRTFSSRSAGDPQAILSYRLWQDWFAGRPDAIGATIWINNLPHTVTGVMPRRFWFSEMNDPVWTLLEPERLDAATRLFVVVRRPTGTGTDAFAARLQASLDEYSRQLPAGQGPLKMRVSEIKGTPMADEMSLILPYILGTAVLLTLLIACANVAILMIAQWTRREAETAVRAALGASRPRLIRAMVAESLLLATCAGIVGIGSTYVIRGIILSNAPLADTFVDLSIHQGVLIKTISITLLAGILAGIGPALIETRRLQLDPLRGIATSDRVRQRWSHTLVVLEITLTLALLVVTSSMIGGYQRSRGAEIGFDLDPFLTASVQNSSGVPTAQLLETIARVPGVQAVSPATSIPMNVSGRRRSVSATATGASAVQAEEIAIGPDFFSILGVPMRAGRAFSRLDTPQIRAVIVSESFARQVFGDSSPIGRQVWMDKAAYDIVGVVADYISTPVESRLAAPKIYLPIPPDTTSMRFLIRATGDPAPLVEPVRRALRNAAVGINVSGVVTLRQMITIVGQEILAGTAPLFPLIVIGMMLTSSGIYGVLAFAVARRSRELAIRVAIGADRGNQIRLVMAHSARLVLIGALFGTALTFGLSRLVRAAGGAGSLYDPPWPAFVAPVLLVGVVAALATWIPTRRALRVNPASLLKAT